VNGILYATLHATTVSAYPSLTYSIVTVYPDTKEIKIIGAGREMSYVVA
jgi:hypothetical protein